MTFLAPWALGIAGLASLATVLLHLVARQRPAAYVLPTARFIPDRRSLVSRVATRPRDLLLLLLRVLLLLSAGAAFARPVLTPRRAPLARIVLLDRSAAVADTREGSSRLQALRRDGVPTQVIVFDSAARAPVSSDAGLDSLMRAEQPARARGSLSAALVAARRAGATLGETADSVSLVLVSPMVSSATDAALASVRAQWPGRVQVERVRARADSASAMRLERAPSVSDPLHPALARIATGAGPHATRIVRGTATSSDTAFARTGGTVVQWDSLTGRASAGALVMGDDVVVATLGRLPLAAEGRTLARWSDGAPAATEREVGAGCIRHVAVGVPIAGDLPLRGSFQRIVRGLVEPCGETRAEVALDSAAVARIAGTPALASGRALAGDAALPPARIVPWLLALALALAIAELVLRRQVVREEA
jgi:hypothetical protein